MVYNGWLNFGGNEVINNARVFGMSRTADCPIGWIRAMGVCDGIREALGDPPYDSVNLASAPWADPDLPDLSSRFYGAYGLGITWPQDSTRQVQVTEGITDGGAVGSFRHAIRSVRVRAALLAHGRDAMDYGRSWLAAALSPGACGQHGEDCGTTDVEFFADCPPSRGLVPYWSPWELQAENLFTNPNFEGGGAPVTVYENLFINPRMAESGATITVYENVFTNPRLVGSGTWAEVQRNRCPSPSFEGGVFSPWNVQSVTAAVSTEWAKFGTRSLKVTTMGANSQTGDVRIGGAGFFPGGITPGGTYTVSAYINLPVAHTNNDVSAGSRQRRMLVFFEKDGVFTQSFGPQAPNVAGEHRISHTFTLPADSTGIIVAVGCASSSVDPGFVTYVDGVLWESGSLLRPYFDGSTKPAGIVQPEDFRTRWLGAVDASESVLEIETVRDMVATNAVAGVSTKAGKPAVRVIPINAGTDSRAYFIIPPEARASGTLLGTLHLDAPLTGLLWSEALTLRALTPGQRTDTPPNAPGIYPQRLTYSGLTSIYWATLNHGGSVGSGDVWWTDIALVPGTYTGPAFNGSDTYPDPDLTATWAGAVDNSISRAYGQRVRGFQEGGTGRVVVRSMQTGKPSGRIIPTGAAGQSAFGAAIPTPGVGVHTILAKATLLAPQTGSLDANARRIFIVGSGGGATAVSTQPPNVAGEHEVRWVVTLTAGDSIRFANGAAAGNGDVFWSDIAIVPGVYNGPAFNGTDPSYDADLTPSWAGAADNSTSLLQGMSLAGWFTTNPSGGLLIRSSRYARAGSYSGRFIRLDSSVNTYAQTTATITPGQGYTNLISILRNGTQTMQSTVAIYDSTISTKLVQVASTSGLGSPEEWVEFRAPVATGGWASPARLLIRPAAQVGDSLWYDMAGLFAGDYHGDWFDGNSDPGPETQQYRWTGAENASTSVFETRIQLTRPETDDEYFPKVDALRRFMHGVATASGPLTISEDVRGDKILQVVEFTLTAVRPWVYGKTTPVSLPTTPPVVVEDVRYNLAPYPSMEKAGAPLVIATNFSTNPSVEVDAVGWTGAGAPAIASMVTSGRSTDIAAVGGASFRVRALGDTAGGGTISEQYVTASQVVTWSGTATGTRFSVTVWGALIKAGGVSGVVAKSMAGTLEWLNASDAVVGTVNLGTTTTSLSGNIFQSKSMLPPGTATKARVTIRGTFDFNPSNATPSDVRLYADAVALTVP